MKLEKYRILTLDASGILEQTAKNGEDIGVCLPKKGSDAFLLKIRRDELGGSVNYLSKSRLDGKSKKRFMTTI